jgi:lipopolysaccharide biosynthesis glycosyltransferase|tara:strand:- start:79 stop:765 length:687 start_codon:yes stop_codon:yes gene_type:complete
MNKVYVGYDSREDIAWKVCFSSIIKRSTNPCTVKPIIQQELRDYNIYRRTIDKNASTEFSITRFLVPFLNEYKGWAVYCDCDFLWVDDITKLFNQADDRYAIQVVKHDYKPKNTTKMDGQTQHLYPRKNWSSMVLWNCSHPANKKLTLEVVNNQTPSFLHRFQWIDDSEIGEVSKEWNWLTDWYSEPDDGSPKALHYTEGGPWMEGYENTSYSNEWKKELNDLKLDSR